MKSCNDYLRTQVMPEITNIFLSSFRNSKIIRNDEHKQSNVKSFKKRMIYQFSFNVASHLYKFVEVLYVFLNICLHNESYCTYVASTIANKILN